MTGPEHFEEAGKLLTVDDPCSYGCPHTGCVHEMATVARAQVHATLALAAATALSQAGEMDYREAEAWVEAAATSRPVPEGAP